MINKWKNPDKLFGVSIVCFFVTAITVFCLPLGNGIENSHKMIRNIIGLLFWLGIIVGALVFGLIWFMIKNRKEYQNIKLKCKPAYKSYFQKPITIISDSVFVSSLILTILGNFIFSFNDVIQILLMFVLLFTFFIHFIFGGRVFRYIIMKRKSLQIKSQG